jgi:predicted amidohydrolase YtcJ
MRKGHGAGMQLMVHAIGDAGLDRALDALEPLCAGGNPLRHRLEHVEVTPPDLVQRLSRSGVRACLQPNFAARWSVPSGLNQQRLGARVEHCNAYRSLLDAGVTSAFGSDCMPLGPLYGLSGATAHPQREQRIAADVALDLYTRAAAELVFAERLHGQIRPGMAADLAVLSGDPLAGDPSQLRVDATFVAGRRVFARPGAAVEPGPGAC